MRDLLPASLARGPSLLAAATVLLTCLPSRTDDPGSAVHVTMADGASVALVAVAATCLVAGRPRLPLRALVLTPLVLAVTAATLTSPDALTSLPGYLRFLQVFVLIPLAVMITLRRREDVWLVGGALVAAAAVQGGRRLLPGVHRNGRLVRRREVRAVGTFGALDVMGMATVVSYGLILLFALGLELHGRQRIAALAGAGLC
ncbi:hypothetical protein [Nonomuraea dietziae]|uniref:hypothetical protein n=1 Tax=Nonomuraea dietziae TaxID=65515 RepID=UPI0031DECEC1